MSEKQNRYTCLTVSGKPIEQTPEFHEAMKKAYKEYGEALAEKLKLEDSIKAYKKRKKK